MGNYKTVRGITFTESAFNAVGVDFNGVLIDLKDGTSIIPLRRNTIATSYKTITDLRDNTAYQVPADKKAHIIYITSCDMSYAADKILYADDEDGSTNAVTLFAPTANITNEIFISAEIPSSKYVNIYGTLSGKTIKIYVVEENV